MEFQDLILKRYSVRAYRNTPVENERLQEILNAVRLAPTASNQQPFRIIVIETKGKQAELLSIYNREWLVQAPLMLCICGLPAEAWVRRDRRQFLDVDIGIVMAHLVLAAAELGLGTCIIAAFDVENARKVLKIPDDVEPLLFTPLGYPADNTKEKYRKNLSELVKYDSW